MTEGGPATRLGGSRLQRMGASLNFGMHVRFYQHDHVLHTRFGREFEMSD
jgi:hypothetical protein